MPAARWLSTGKAGSATWPSTSSTACPTCSCARTAPTTRSPRPRSTACCLRSAVSATAWNARCRPKATCCRSGLRPAHQLEQREQPVGDAARGRDRQDPRPHDALDHAQPQRARVLGEAHAHDRGGDAVGGRHRRSEEHTSDLQSLMRISYAVFCLKKKKKK